MKIFHSDDLYQYLQQCNKRLEEEVIAEEKNRLLNVDETTYIDYLISTYTVQPLIFDWDAVYATESEKLVSANHFPRGYMMGAHHEKSYTKQVITYHIPFSGSHILLQMKPSTHLLWTNEIELSKKLDEISFDIINFDNDSQKIKNESDNTIASIKQQSNYISEQIGQYNSEIKNRATNIIAQRKAELLKQSNLLESLGVPIKRSVNVSETFAVPVKRKQIVIQKPPSTNQAFIPEPELDKKIYCQILEICQGLGIEMERHPSIYKEKDEEALRDLFLMMLSPHFDSVTGETFNKQGKTDILIKYEGKNIFVAECKFWRGAKSHIETIDQILSYLTWRESKSAIIYFVDNKNLQPVLDSITSETPHHKCFAKSKEKNGEAWFNYHFYLLSDNTRGVELAILVFHLSSS